MLRSTKELNGYSVVATDGELGSVTDIYFDDEQWAVRYVIVDTGRWLAGRRVLMSPLSVRRPDWVEQRLPVTLTRDEVRSSPSADQAKPVSRQQERELFRYYGYPFYWRDWPLWGVAPYPQIAAEQGPLHDTERDADVADGGDDIHLRSCREVAGYHLEASDGGLGHVHDFLFDDLDWAIRYIVVDTSDWWLGRRVLIAPEWVGEIDWQERSMRVDVSRRQIQSAPQYDSVGHVNRQWEADYYTHHQREPYWISAREARRIRARQLHPPVIAR